MAESVLHIKLSINTSIYQEKPVFTKSFLHQKYEQEGLSLRQIADLKMSSKSIVRDALIHFGIELRGKGSGETNPRFGRRKIGNRTVAHRAEARVIDIISKMELEGMSLRAIARILNEMKVPTKKPGSKWHHHTVKSVLNHLSNKQ